MEMSQIEAMAYQLWEQRGKPLGTPESDWFLAEELFRKQLGRSQSWMDELPLFSISMVKRTR